MTEVLRNRERSAGRHIQWRELPAPTITWAGGGKTHTGKAYISDQSKCTVLVSHTTRFGWHFSIAHPWRHPSWDEIASARYTLVPGDIAMVMVLPPEDEYVNVHEHCFHLHECRCPR